MTDEAYFAPRDVQPNWLNEPALDGARWVGPLVADPPAEPLYRRKGNRMNGEKMEEALDATRWRATGPCWEGEIVNGLELFERLMAMDYPITFQKFVGMKVGEWIKHGVTAYERMPDALAVTPVGPAEPLCQPWPHYRKGSAKEMLIAEGRAAFPPVAVDERGFSGAACWLDGRAAKITANGC